MRERPGRAGRRTRALAGASPAATIWYWDGGTQTSNTQSDNTTTTGQNWLSGGYWDNGTSQTLASWTAGDSAIFGGSAASQTITAGTFTIGNLTFGGGADGSGTSGTAYTITGGTLTLSSTTITANTATIIGSTLAGTSTLTKAGNATLTLTANSNYDGAVTVNAGVLQLNDARSMNGSITVNSGATLTLQSNGSGGYYQPDAGLTVNNGTVNSSVAASNRYHGIYTTAINLTGTSSIGTPLFISKSGTTSTDTLTITVSSGSSTISGTILNHPDLSGGLLVKSGGGTLKLTGVTAASGITTTLTGNVTINGGTLDVGGTVNSTSPTVTAIGNMTTSGRTVTVNSGAVLSFSGSDAIGAYNYISPVMLIADGGTITRVASTTTFNSIGNVTLKNGAHLTTTNGNASNVGSFGLNGNVTVSGTSGSFIDTLSGQTTNSFINLGYQNMVGSTTFDVGSTGDLVNPDLTVSAVLADKTLGGAAALVKTGAGKMVLSGANTFTGNITINNGMLVDNKAGTSTSGLGNMTTGGRTITINSGGTLRFDVADAMAAYNAKTTVALIADGGTITRTAGAFNSLGDITLRNGGHLTSVNGQNATVNCFSINGDVTVDGTSGSFIDTTGSSNNGIHLATAGLNSSTVIFTVASTGDATADLTVSAPLIDKTLGGAANILKAGEGKMVV